MIFSLDIRRARQGDCLLLHFGSADAPGLVLIDGGPSGVYGPHLKPRLLEIKKARGLEKTDPLPVDLLMVSHVDDDHIQGILDMTREMLASTGAPLVDVASFWHNSFDEIIGKHPRELTAAVAAHFGPASLSGGLPADATIDADEEEEVILSTLKVLASIAQGHRLRQDAEHEKLAWPRNPEFGEKLILASAQAQPVAEGLTFVVVGPMKPELLALQKKHDLWLKAQEEKEEEDSGGALAAYIDKSVPNLASIIVLAAVGGKRMLLTGDARGDKVLEGLEHTGLLEPGKSLHVDLLKVPHHGSANNLDHDFFARITADHYVFSGNGEHGNPEREALEMLFGARGNEAFEIHLTYPVDEIDVAREEEWKRQQAREKRKKAAGGTKTPREDWSPVKHSLAALFENATRAEGQRIVIVPEKQAHVVDLLDPLGH